ncbi:RDD family protein [Teredinibacter haidensis]|uniref:RDD family protein n=1 Tax=Teredinibacter haidensis TaxID=2731755 RepID=UPI000948917B|nr:RDD family protein [Teredinibacter haidensis]
MAEAFITDTSKGAPLWRRFASMLYDSFLLMALSMGYGALATLVLFLIHGDSTGGEYQPMVTSSIGNLLLLTGLVTTLTGFYVFFWHRAGQTAGMRAWRLQVITLSELPEVRQPSLTKSLARAPLSFLAIAVGGLGYWWRAFDINGDCLHDKLSQTRVILTAPRKKKSAPN